MWKWKWNSGNGTSVRVTHRFINLTFLLPSLSFTTIIAGITNARAEILYCLMSFTSVVVFIRIIG